MRRLTFSLLFPALILALAAPVAAQTPTPTPAPESEQRIAPGVKAGHVDVGGLLVEEAAAKLEATLGARLQKNIGVSVAGRRFSLTMKRVGFSFDALRTAKRAYYAGRNAPPPAPESGGQTAGVDVPLAVRFRRAQVRDFASSVARQVYVAPRNATLRITLRRMIKRRARSGRYTHAGELRAAIEAAIADAALGRLIKPGRKVVPAKVNANHLASRYPTVLTVDRANFKLRLFKRLKLTKTYGIAVGAAGYDTPTGLKRITNKAVNPAWTAPNKPWAGLYAGRRVPGGAPDNPLKARWLGIANGVGIHGTGAEYSIGSRASHGCIRMRVKDVIDLYPRVPVGTPVLIR